jgi:hypothetical protein
MLMLRYKSGEIRVVVPADTLAVKDLGRYKPIMT